MNYLRRTALIILTGLTFSLAGCAAPLIFSKPGGITNIGEFRTDNYHCVQQSRTSWSGGGTGALGAGMMLAAKLDAHQQANKLYKLCMGARGYEARPLQEGEVVQH